MRAESNILRKDRTFHTIATTLRGRAGADLLLLAPELHQLGRLLLHELLLLPFSLLHIHTCTHRSTHKHTHPPCQKHAIAQGHASLIARSPASPRADAAGEPSPPAPPPPPPPALLAASTTGRREQSVVRKRKFQNLLQGLAFSIQSECILLEENSETLKPSKDWNFPYGVTICCEGVMRGHLPRLPRPLLLQRRLGLGLRDRAHPPPL